jgi:hypothetical protein
MICFSGSVSIIFICKKFLINVEVLSRLFSFMGKNSMVFYGIQAVMVGILNTIIRHFVAEDVLYSGWGIAVSVLSLTVSVAVDSCFVLFYRSVIEPRICKSCC